MPTAPTQTSSSDENWRKKIYAHMAHRTESGDDPSSIYRLSHTGTDFKAAGYSVGRIQVDLAGMPVQRERLLKAVYDWLVEQGKKPDPSSWIKKATEELSKTGDPTALSKDNKDALMVILQRQWGMISRIRFLKMLLKLS